MIKCNPKSVDTSKCSTRYPSTCGEYVYQLSTTKEPIYDASKVTIDTSLLFTENGILTYEEISSYSFVTTVDNVGRQLRLRVGLSAAIIVQIVIFFSLKCFSGRQQRKVSRVKQIEEKYKAATITIICICNIIQKAAPSMLSTIFCTNSVYIERTLAATTCVALPYLVYH